MEGHRKGRTRPSNLREQVDPETMKMYPTPTQDSASERTKKYKQGGTPLPLAVKMYPTPTRVCEEGGEQSHLVERTKSGGFVSRRKGSGITYGSKLSDAMLYLEKEKKKMLPTPTTGEQKYRLKGDSQASKCLEAMARRGEINMYYSPTTNDSKNLTFPKSQKNRTSVIGDMIRMKKNKPGGKLNPIFVEFLMGFPMNWTKTEPTESKPLETQSSHKSQESSDSQSKKFYPTPRANEPGRTTKGYGRGLAELMEGKEQVEPKKMYRTPTAMDKGDNSFKYAAKILKGKLNRSESKQPVQKTLSMDVAMEHLKDNQHLINEYDEKFKTRPHLPPKDIFLKYLRNNLDKKKLVEDDIIKKTTIDHWLRSDHCFAYPTVEYWNMIKPYLKEIRFDKEMTTEIESDWE